MISISDQLVILMITGMRADTQSFRREVETGSCTHCLLERECRRRDTSDSEADRIVRREV